MTAASTSAPETVTVNKSDLSKLVAALKQREAEIEGLKSTNATLMSNLQHGKAAERLKPPSRIHSTRQEFYIGDMHGYINFGEYPDGGLAEVFISPGKEGSLVWGLANGLGKLLSIAIQHGVPLTAIINAFQELEFEPSGPVRGVDGVKGAFSLLDLLAKILRKDYLSTKKKIVDKSAEAFARVEETIDSSAPAGEQYEQCPECKAMALREKAVGCNAKCLACGYLEPRGCGE